MKPSEFARTHTTDPDWISALELAGKEAIVLVPGQVGWCNGYRATVIRHYCNGMYEIGVPGGSTCVSAEDFTPDGHIEMAIWFQDDARLCYDAAAEYRDAKAGVFDWIAARVQLAAAHSSLKARQLMGIED